MTRHLVTFVALMMASGCVATDVGNPQTDPVDVETEISLEAYVAEPPPNALALPDGVEITHAWVATNEIRFRKCDNDGDDDADDTATTTDPFVTDLLTGTSLPGAPGLSEPLATFCHLEFRVLPLDAASLPDGAPPDLAGLSVLVRGTRKDGNPFVLHAKFDEKLDLSGDIALSGDILNRLVVGFAANDWLTQGDLAAFTGNPILLDDETAPEVLDRFRDAFKRSAGLFREATSGTPLAEADELE